MTDDYGLAFTHGDSIVSDGDLDVSGLGEFPTVLAQFELVKVPAVVLFGLVGFVDFFFIDKGTLEGLLVHYYRRYLFFSL